MMGVHISSSSIRPKSRADFVHMAGFPILACVSRRKSAAFASQKGPVPLN